MKPEPTAAALIEHQIPGRIRFRVSSRRGDAPFFARVVEALRGQDGIVAVRSDAFTGSIVVEHAMDTERVVAAAKGLFAVTAPQNRQTLVAKSARIHSAQGPFKAVALSAVSGAFAVFGTYQLARGRATGSGADLLWKAYGAYASVGQPWASAALIGCALYALTQGRVLSPGASLLYYALSARHMAQKAAVTVDEKIATLRDEAAAHGYELVKRAA